MDARSDDEDGTKSPSFLDSSLQVTSPPRISDEEEGEKVRILHERIEALKNRLLATSPQQKLSDVNNVDGVYGEIIVPFSATTGSILSFSLTITNTYLAKKQTLLLQNNNHLSFHCILCCSNECQ